MANTPHLGITLLEQSQAQKEVTLNEALYRVDALLNSGVIDKDLSTPPGSPAQGDVYIVASSPTGAWSGKAKHVAYFDQIWRFITPNEGLMLWVADENKHYVYDGSVWNELDTGGGGGSGDMAASTYDPANIAQQIVGTSATQTLTNKTLTAPTINGTVSGDAMVKICQARLTLTSGTPITTSDVSSASSVYVTPFYGNHMALYDGSTWKVLSFTEITHSLSGATNSRPHDLFAYISSGAVAVERLAWTDDTTRATALSTQDGVYVKSGDATRRYLGSFYVNSSTQTEDTLLKRHVWNCYNRVSKNMRRAESTASWTYSTSAFRQANNNTANQLDVMFGLAEDLVEACSVGFATNSTTTARNIYSGVGIDSSTSATNSIATPAACTSTMGGTAVAEYRGFLLGRHTIRWLEYAPGTDTQTWYGAGYGNAIIATGRF